MYLIQMLCLISFFSVMLYHLKPKINCRTLNMLIQNNSAELRAIVLKEV